ncbi:aldehyde dehydrogenase family protein, partial [Mesorhizobium japonicum]|uniref:aldehyde dehydrogenase family protein n=1 Tax=Mesorhizobium japonicum TaxID=2066070 RepID=UPI003B593046
MSDTLSIVNPSDATVIRELELATAADVAAAVERAATAQAGWARLAPAARAAALRRFAG